MAGEEVSREIEGPSERERHYTQGSSSRSINVTSLDRIDRMSKGEHVSV